MANNQTFANGLTNDGDQITTLANVQGAGLKLPLPSANFINIRSPGKLRTLFQINGNAERLYSINKPEDAGLANVLKSRFDYKNPNQGQRSKITSLVGFAVRDANLVRKFLGSSKGGRFITKQLILQGFQPFDETKVYNPASPILASFRRASFGALDRPKRFVDTSNLIGGLLGATGLGGVVKTVGGLFGASPGTPSPPRSTVASKSSSPKGGLGGFLNIGGIFGGGDLTEIVMPATNRGGARGLIRGNTATNAYKGTYYSSLLSPKPKGGFFSNLLKAAGSFLKNKTLLGGILPPTQPIKGLNYRADEDTYKLMLISDRWSNFTIQGGDKSKYWDPGVNQGNLLLYTGTQSTSRGGFMGTLLKGLGFNTSKQKAGSSAIRFYNGGNSSNKLRLYVNKNIGGRNNSKLITTFDTTSEVGKLNLTHTTKVSTETIDKINENNIKNSSNRYGDVVKVTDDFEYSDQLFNYSIFTDEKLSKNYKTTFSDKEAQSVKDINRNFDKVIADIGGTFGAGTKYSVNQPELKPLQFAKFSGSADSIGTNYLKQLFLESSNPRSRNNKDIKNDTYQGRLRRNNEPAKQVPSRLGEGADDRYIRPTNNVDYVNALEVQTPEQFKKSYSETDKFGVYGPDIIKFYFYDIINQKYIPFRATVKSISDNNNATWEDIQYLGRPDKLYYYKGFTRSVSFNFTVNAHSIKELMPMWNRINYLVGLTRPANYTMKINGGFMVSPIVQLTLGDFYKNHNVVINSCNVTIPEDAGWETIPEDDQQNWYYGPNKAIEWDSSNMLLNSSIDQRKGRSAGRVAQFPRSADIQIEMNVLEKDRPYTGKAIWGDAPVTISNPDPTFVGPTLPGQEIPFEKFDKQDDPSLNTFSKNIRVDVNATKEKK